MKRWVALPWAGPACLCVSLALGAVDARAELNEAAIRDSFVDRVPEAIGPPEGEPAVWPIRMAGGTVAWAASSYEMMGSIGYSAKPIDVIVVVGEDARILATRLLVQDEPILTIGVSDADLRQFVGAFVGADIRESLAELRRDGAVPDAVSGATISSGVIRDAVVRTGRLIADRAGLFGGGAVVADDGDAVYDWASLLEIGAVATMTVDFEAARDAMPGARTLPDGAGEYVSLAVALAGPASVGRSLMGGVAFDRFAADLALGDHVLFVAGRGLYSFKGTAWRRSGTFDRLELSQDGKVIPLGVEDHSRLDGIAADGAPAFREAAAFRIRKQTGFDPVRPFRLALIIDQTGQGAQSVARFELDYRLPPRFVASDAGRGAGGLAAIDDEALWLQNWRAVPVELAILAVMLVVLLAVLYVSGPLVRRPRLYLWFRLGFLSMTLVWLGWIAGAQLSVVQVVSFVQALLDEFRWEIFLLAPLIFVLWSFVALFLVFWGRGVYCGWLCPFGALQELLHAAGQRLGVKRIEVPWEIHERLWPLKYIALFVIVGLSFQDVGLAFTAAEVEPFKTAITLYFLRDWPFVLYALVLLGIGLFVERAFCRYLCPLGAALAIPSKFKVFDWLIRRPQCGRECKLCATTCTVQAIDQIGRINHNECIYCLQCQVNYYDVQTCVPLKMRARRRAGLPLETGDAAGQSRDK